MRAISSVASITIHVGLGAAFLLGTTKPGRSSPTPPQSVVVVFPRAPQVEPVSTAGVPGVPILTIPDVPVIPLPVTVLHGGARSQPALPVYAPSGVVSGGQPDSWIGVLGEERPEVLTGPLPVYPELLRQAGVEGQVVLEALVDTTGRVHAPSIAVVAATHPGFVAPARHALRATLFRPARVGGRPVRMLIRVPFDFTIRSGTGRAR